MSNANTNPKETISFWVFGGDVVSYKEPDGLTEDYKAVAEELKESLDSDSDSVDFSIQTSNLFYPEITLPECAKALNEEIEIMIQTIKTVLVVPDNILEEIKQTVTEYGEMYKKDDQFSQEESQLNGIGSLFSIAIEVQMQPVENDEGGTEIQVGIRAFKVWEDDDFDDESPEAVIIEEKDLYFDMVSI